MSVFLSFIAVAYLFPTVRLILLPYHFFKPETTRLASTLLYKNQRGLRRLILFLCAFEYYTQALRRFTFGYTTFFCWLFFVCRILLAQPVALVHFVLLSFYVLLIVWTRQHKRMTDLRLVELLRHCGQISPEIIFNLYKYQLTFGGVSFSIEKDVEDISPEHANFRQGTRPQLNRFILIKGVVDTAYLAHFCLTALNCVGPEYAFAVADPIAQLWGRRLLQIARGEFVLRGAQNLHGKTGRFLLIFNHKSSFDFVLAFFAFSLIRINERLVRPRFILAKDHFKDNFLIYRIFGIGRTCEAIRMVFIARKDRRQSERNLQQAAQTLVNHDVELAIYPQGTRAAGNFDRAGKRRDAGYFTTFSQRDLISSLSHLKKGTAHLVWETLALMESQGKNEDLNLVFVGINGAGISFPKGALRVQTENEISFTIGEVVTLKPKVIKEIREGSSGEEEFERHKKEFVREMLVLINERLIGLIAIRDTLKQRFLTELTGQFHQDRERITAVEEEMLAVSKKSDVVSHILDRIYCLPTSSWNAYLSGLSQLLMEKSPLDRYENLLLEVSEHVLRLRH